MLKGVAKAGGDDPHEDHYGIVVALSNLSETLGGPEATTTFAAAAEAGATLLRTARVMVFITDDAGGLAVAGSAGITSHETSMVDAAREVAKAVLASSGPVVYPGASSFTPVIKSRLKACKMASAMGVPMRVGETNVGAFAALSPDAHAFTPGDIDLLHVVAGQAAAAAKTRNQPRTNEDLPEDQDALIELAERKIQELSLVNKVSEAVNSTLNLERLLDIALEQSMAAVGADAGSLMLINKETNKLEIVASRGLAKRLVKHAAQKLGSSISGWVAEHGESALIADAHKDLRFKMPFFRDSINSAAAVPLKVKGAVIGVLNVNTVHPDRVFDERDLQLLGTVANQMAVAIENARLYDRVNRRTKQLDSLLHISRTVTSTLNLDEVMRQLCDELCKLFVLDACVLLLYDDLSGRFRFGHGTGLKTRKKYVYYDLAAPFAARIKATGSKVLIKNIGASPLLRTEVSHYEGFKSAVCMPIKNQGKLVGIAAGFSRERRSLAASQQDILRPLGDLAGVAIDNARMYRQKYKMAAILQEKLTPSVIPEVEGLDIGHKFLPARGVGGDYYDFIKSAPDRLGVIVGDVSGSDVEAAEYTTMGKYVLRTYAREYESPAEVLARTNVIVCEDSRTEMFISLFYGVLDLGRRKLRYASAGCEQPLLYKAKTKSILALGAEGMLLGIKPNAVYNEQEIAIEPGDILLVHTDGLPEASVGSARFGSEAVRSVLAKSADKSGQTVVDHLYEALMEFGHGRATDDVAMVAIKVL